MNATLEARPSLERRAIEKRFLELLPGIRSVARYAFRRRPRAHRDDLIAEVIANAYLAFRRLVQKDKADLAYPSVLGWFAVRQVREGRRVGNRLNGNDAMSNYAQTRKGFEVEPLRRPNASGQWEDLVVEDKRSTPAEIAACRLDFRAWMRRLNPRRRAVALRLAGGETTQDAARRFRLSKSRISQYRQELRSDWQEFQGERVTAAA
jgi:hypothetical protein